MEDDLLYKNTLDKIPPSMEYNLQKKTNFNRKQPLMVDDLRWKTTWCIVHIIIV